MKITDCDRCFLYSHNPYLICAVHPSGVDTETCLDFRPVPNAETEEQWQPEGASYYDGELILHRPRLTREEQLEILDNHPFFTNACPQCGHQFDRNNPPVHYDCPSCDFIDDSV